MNLPLKWKKLGEKEKVYVSTFVGEYLLMVVDIIIIMPVFVLCQVGISLTETLTVCQQQAFDYQAFKSIVKGERSSQRPPQN